MPRRKRQPEPFDVGAFLRETDDDLKSALNSLLRSPQPEARSEAAAPPINIDPGIKLRPAIVDRAPSNLASGPNIDPGTVLNDAAPVVEPAASAPQIEQPVISEAGINLIPGPDLTLAYPGAASAAAPVRKKRRFPIREMKLAQDGHTRAEQQVYEALWTNARPMDEISRSITLGLGAMARIVRLSESNARINLRGLIAKLAVEEIGRYDCERSTGRTYRIFNYAEILRRRKAAGLVWYMRRTQAVVFVDPITGEPIELGIRRAGRLDNSGPGPNLIPPPGLNLIPGPGPNLGGGPGPNLTPPYREEELENSLRETSSSADRLLWETLSAYGTVDDDVVARLKATTAQICPDYTNHELLHFIRAKGALIRKHDRSISNPIGFLLSAVPKCFVGESFQLYRRAEQEARQREATERAKQEDELQAWRQDQQAILDDPNASEENKRWARKLLNLPESREGS